MLRSSIRAGLIIGLVAGVFGSAVPTVRSQAETIKIVSSLPRTGSSKGQTVSMPILNRANLVMISPANTYPGLTKPGKGTPNEPGVYAPTGVRNYARVVPADDLQGTVAARWAERLGVQRAYVLDDTELYGHI